MNYFDNVKVRKTWNKKNLMSVTLPKCNDWDNTNTQVYKAGPNPTMMWTGLSLFVVFLLIAYCVYKITESGLYTGLSGLFALLSFVLFIFAFVTVPVPTALCEPNPELKPKV